MTLQLPRPERLLGQNSELRAIGVYQWTLPALATRLPDGRTIRTCPSAGVCAHVCYARSGTYRFRNVFMRHLANLAYVIEDLPGWEAQMTAELQEPRFFARWIRVHDAGDFFSDEYTLAWLRIMKNTPDTNFYAYTKQVSLFRRLVEPNAPMNFRWVYSLGGAEDHLLTEHDRQADVFPDADSIEAAGWHSQEESDLLSVTGPTKVGIPANNIPQFLNRQAGRSLREWQAEVAAKRAARRQR